jgi:molybdopterin synthase sulfur carrier subunit
VIAVLRVRLFASLRERLGRGELAVAPPPGVATVASLVAHLELHELPGCGALLLADNTVIAVNREVCDRERTLADGDEVAFYPPVTGG